MRVIRTDKWLLNAYEQPLKLCEKLKKRFNENISAEELHQHFIMHGMYRQPLKHGKKLIQKLQKRNIWQMVHQEAHDLQKEWNGPDIPIFILPADTTNQKLTHDQNGKSGLSFPDKVFLFISDMNTEKEICALLTHEYNHICRLSKYNKKESEYTLLDTVILEGLAENAVRERFGERYTAKWVSYYSDARLNRICTNLILPNRNALKSSHIHAQLLYGLGFYPEMAGYCAGYHLVERYMNKENVTSQDLLPVKSDIIIEQTDDS
ncbi:hypothetical protein GCM10007063_28660 [Lentibacillus kapialis]|uniref:DUF2268 domain-containing protein n=1 Tax=Lentibacillus kapialis TaxID=340214 RepID=A0A917Q0A3_9BACI|nr:DUF2268 domain-containing protein [Lentibacillus kapialis]GGK04608.1 hypothetical protein GCM10007063_28660 [Lentibacillus kapialis]